MEIAAWKSWWRRVGADELRAVTMNGWDPIGVSEYPEAADEYDDYLGQIVRRLRESVADEELAAFLSHVRTVTMGLEPNPAADLAAAHAMREWYDASIARFETSDA